MRNFTKLWISKTGLLLLLLLLGPLSSTVLAAHYRGGLITWVKTSLKTVSFTVYTGTVAGQISLIDAGDGTTFSQGTGATTGDLSGDSYTIRVTTFTHTYATEDLFIATFSVGSRFPLINAPGGPPFTSFIARTVVDLRPGSNQTGSSKLDPLTPVTPEELFLLQFNKGINEFQIPVSDPDDSSVTCRLATSAESGIPSAAEAGGNALSVTTDCRLQWNTSLATHTDRYAVQVILEDNSDLSEPIRTTAYDFIIEINENLVSNIPPVADAGTDFSVAAGAVANLSGSGADSDGTVVGALWTQTAGPFAALSPSSDGGVTSTSATPSFNVPNEADGTSRTFQLIVTDDDGAASDPLTDTNPTVVVTTTNAAPTANAGADAPVNAGAVANLDGTGSSDPEGLPFTFLWTQTAGLGVALSPSGDGGVTSTSATPSFNVPNEANGTSRTFQLIVNDGFQDSVADTVVITTTNLAPIANAGPDQGAGGDIFGGDMVTLDGSGSSDPEGLPFTFLWTQTAGTDTVGLSDATAASPTFTAPNVTLTFDEVYTFQLVVNDGFSDSVADTVNITVTNAPPVANAGGDQSIPGTLVTLNGGASFDPESEPLTFSWELTPAEGAEVHGLNEVDPHFFTDPTPVNEDLSFQLTVNDGVQDNLAAPDPSPPADQDDTAIITVLSSNFPPVCDPAGVINMSVAVNSLAEVTVIATDPNTDPPDPDTLTVSISPDPDDPSLLGEATFTANDGSNPAAGTLSWRPDTETDLLADPPIPPQEFEMTFSDGVATCTSTISFTGIRPRPLGSLSNISCTRLDPDPDENGREGIASIDIRRRTDGSVSVDDLLVYLGNFNCDPALPSIEVLPLPNIDGTCGPTDGRGNGCVEVSRNSPTRIQFVTTDGDAIAICYDLERGAPAGAPCNPLDLNTPNLGTTCTFFCAPSIKDGNCTGSTYACIPDSP